MILKLYDLSIFIYIYAILGCITFRYEDTALIYIAIIAVFLFSVLELFRKNWKLSWNGYETWYLINNIFWIISIIWSIDRSKYLDVLNPYIYLIIISMIFFSIYISNQHNYNKLLCYIVIASCIVAAKCVAATDLSNVSIYYNRGMFAAKLLTEGVNYNYFTTGFCLASIIAFYLAYIKAKKGYYLAYSLLLLVCVFSGSRKAIIISVLAAIIFLLLNKRDSSIAKKAIIIIGIVAAVYFLIMNIPTLYDAVGTIMEELLDSILGRTESVTDASLVERAFYRRKAVEVFLDNPVIGVGVNNFSAVLEQLNYSHAVYAHNNFLELLADGGIVGFAIYYSYYLTNLYILTKNYIRKNYSDSTLLTMTFIILLLIIEYGQITYMSPSAQLIFMVILIGHNRFKTDYTNDDIYKY